MSKLVIFFLTATTVTMYQTVLQIKIQEVFLAWEKIKVSSGKSKKSLIENCALARVGMMLRKRG